jgi:Na+/H+ antiporter NhaC
MKELDLLKKDWQKNKDSFEQVSEIEIYKMIHKKSSSIVKWILIISIIEFSLGIILNILLSFTKVEEKNTEFIKSIGVYNYYQAFTIILYVVIIYFILQFYFMYRNVAATDSTKLLMKNILKARKTVQNYILFNLVTFAVFFIAISAFGFKSILIQKSIEHNGHLTGISSSVYIISFLVIIVVTAIITTAIWLFYRLLYGILLRRLHTNYKELKKIDL